MEDANGKVLTLEQAREKYGFEPDGTNFYFGINQANVEGFASTGHALNAYDRDFIAGFVAALKSSGAKEKTLILGVEPSQGPRPYAYVLQHLAIIEKLAVELAEFQAEAEAAGKQLNVVIRYASEMNDTGQVQGGNPVGYKETFIAVQQAFAKHAPGIPISFSPALRADLPETSIAQYWPGDEYVGVIGGTWYVGSMEQEERSLANMRAYFIRRVGAKKPFAISELGGCKASSDHSGEGNDAMMQRMLDHLRDLKQENVSFRYVTLFLQSKWGTDATLAFAAGLALNEGVA